MKTPLWFPQSFFARTLWLVLIVVLFSKALTLVYLMMNEDVLVDRQYSHGAALTLRAYWAAAPEDRATIAEAAGLKRVPHEQVPATEQHWPYSEIFARQMQTELGPDTEVRVRAKSPPALWVHAPALGDDWLRVAVVPASAAWPADLECAGLVPGDRPVVDGGGVDFRTPAQRTAQAPGVCRPTDRQGAQRAPASG